MKLSVAAFRASATNVNRHFTHPVRQQIRQSTTTFNNMARSVSWGSNQQVEMDDETTGTPPGPGPPSLLPSSIDPSKSIMVDHGSSSGPSSTAAAAKCPQLATEDEEEKRSLLEIKPSPNTRRDRSRGNQRWMKLRTTVQISGAVASVVKDKKPPLKREDSFLKRFSTRQIAESQDTVDGDGALSGDGGAGSSRRRRRRQREGPITVINPDENFYFIWLTVLTVCVLYNCWTLIVRQALPELQHVSPHMWYAGDAFTDLIFLCDIALQFRTGYLEQGLMVYDSKKLALHYMKSRAFAFDLASLFPLDFIQLIVWKATPMLRFPRFLKVYRSYNYYYMVESRTLYPNLWRVVNLIHVLLLLAHWFGCFYYLISEAEGFQGHWVYPEPKGEFANLTRKYLGSLYWSTLTLTTIGDLPTPETDWEFLFTIVSYLIGVFIFATIVGQVGNVITNRNASRLEFERLLDGAKLYMRQHKVPRDMQRRVQRWYDYSWSRGRMQGGGDINSALGILPDKLKTELALHVNLNTLKKVSIFQECQPEFLHDLVLKMKAYIFTPGDLICRKGEVAREMFIIADGILEVISETGKVLTTMKAGDFFGEIGILNLDGLNKRTADVRSVGYSELFSLSREDILAAMKDYPEAQEILQSLGRKRLMEAKMAAAGIKRDTDSDSRKGSSSGGGNSCGDGESAKNRAVQMVMRLKKNATNFIFRRGRQTRNGESKIELESMPCAPMPELGSPVDGGSEARMSDTTFAKRFPWSRGESDEERDKKSRLLRTKSSRGILTRMQRVNSQSEPPGHTPPTPTKRWSMDVGQLPDRPIGAGLPLLQRLRLLKEKQTRDAMQQQSIQAAVPLAPPSEEPLGAGLPLLKRLKLLKEKEKEEKAPQPAPVAEKTTPIVTVSPMPITDQQHRVRRLKDRDEHEADGKMSTAKAALLKKLETLREEEKGESMDRSRSLLEEEWPRDADDANRVDVTVLLHQPATSAHEKEQQKMELKTAPAKKSGWQAFQAVVVNKQQEEEDVVEEDVVVVDDVGGGGGGDDAGGKVEEKASEVKVGVEVDVDVEVDVNVDVGEKKDEIKRDFQVEDKTSLGSLKVKLERTVANNIKGSALPPSFFDPSLAFKPEEYLADLLVGVKQVLQTRLEDIQQQFKSRLVSLEEEVRRKDVIIRRLEDALQHGDSETGRLSATPLPIFEEELRDASLADDDCPSSSESRSGFDDDYFEDDFEEASDVTHPGYVAHPRRSWPLLPPWSERHRVSERRRPWESQAALEIDPEQLWRVEFPVESGTAHDRHWMQLREPEDDDDDDANDEEQPHERTVSDASDDVFDKGSERTDLDETVTSNDWEVKMLAHQLLKKEDRERTDSEGSPGARRGDARPRRPKHDEANASAKRKCSDVPCREEKGAEDGGDAHENETENEADHIFAGKKRKRKEQSLQSGEGEGDGENLLGVLQQLSPTERRELERLLEVATRRHLTRQMSLQVQQSLEREPLTHQRSLGLETAASRPSNGYQDGVEGVRRRSSLTSASATAATDSWTCAGATCESQSVPSAYAEGDGDGEGDVAHAATEQCFFEDETPRREVAASNLGLLSPPSGDEDAVAICIAECEPLLGPK